MCHPLLTLRHCLIRNINSVFNARTFIDLWIIILWIRSCSILHIKHAFMIVAALIDGSYNAYRQSKLPRNTIQSVIFSRMGTWQTRTRKNKGARWGRTDPYLLEKTTIFLMKPTLKLFNHSIYNIPSNKICLLSNKTNSCIFIEQFWNGT